MPAFLKYGDIKGEAREAAHSSWIEVWSVSYGSRNPNTSGPGGGSGTAPVRSNDITVAKSLDSTSPLLFQESISGKAVPAIIDFVREGGGTYLRYELTDAMISSFSTSAGGSSAKESLTLNFSKIAIKDEPGTPP